MASFPALVADEAAAHAAVGTAVQSRDAAAAMDEARDAHRALSVEDRHLAGGDGALSALSAGEARRVVEHVDGVRALRAALPAIQASAGFDLPVESLLGGDVATLLVENASSRAHRRTARRRRCPRARRPSSFDDASPPAHPRRVRVRRERFSRAGESPLWTSSSSRKRPGAP